MTTLSYKLFCPAALHRSKINLLTKTVLEINVTATHSFYPLCSSRDPKWQPKEYPWPLLHPFTLQAAAAATAAVLPVPGGAQPADQQHCTIHQQPQNTRNAVQVGFSAVVPVISIQSIWFGIERLIDLKEKRYHRKKLLFSDDKTKKELLFCLFI